MMVIILIWGLFFGEDSATVTVNVTGIDRVAGTIRIGIYDSAQTFPKDGKQMKGVVKKVGGTSQAISFDLPPNKKYAFAVFHDVNGNNKLDKNMMGIPTEKYGFSNNARETFSAPAFKDASVQFSENARISIRLD